MSERTLRAIVVDDEPLALDLMVSLLGDIENIELVAACNKAVTAIDLLHHEAVDLVFLDIQMPEINGFEFIKRIQPEIFPHIIFTTAFARYAVDAFRIHAVDYLLKPFDEKRLFSAVEKARQAKPLGRYDGEFKRQILDAIKEITEKMEPSVIESHVSPASKISVRDRPHGLTLAVKERGNTKFILLSDILWLEAAGDYVLIHTNRNVFSLRDTMKAVEAQLDSANFARVHRSTIVNKAYVQEILPLQKGEASVVLLGGVKIKASRNYRENIRDLG